MITRRDVLAVAGAAAVAGRPAAAQTGAAPPDAGAAFAEAVRAGRMPITAAAERFAGRGYDWLVAQGRAARFFCLGEEHGIAENARLAAALVRDLAPAGYARVAVEISPPMAAAIDGELRRGGPAALARFLKTPGRGVAFFSMREEADWLADARAAIGGREQVVWGTDYEPFADRHLIALLADAPKPPGARAALARLAEASARSWDAYRETRDLRRVFGFSGDPALVAAVRDAWPRPDRRSADILDTLAATLAINRRWAAGEGYASNVQRAANLRENFLRYWRPHATAADAPRVFLKYGSSHLVRGQTALGTFDTGSLVAELAALRGERSFHLLVLPGAGSPTAVLDPETLTHRPTTPKDGYRTGLERLTAEAWPDVPTLFDTGPLRRLVLSARLKADPELVRTVMGFDAVLVLSGSTASTNL